MLLCFTPFKARREKFLSPSLSREMVAFFSCSDNPFPFNGEESRSLRLLFFQEKRKPDPEAFFLEKKKK